ncbi:MAG: TetR/AcrR family transcriptional regulator [Rhodobiaceae bacterium]|nr:TetR/AcrR family transcriptional regulator [Rhodobiaceae bacterium]MCC0057155.1 TetR/AcrR family transcriptional regulator [Rhodobiaceae bacterium]
MPPAIEPKDRATSAGSSKAKKAPDGPTPKRNGSAARAPAGRKAQRRHQILSAALAVFSEQGFAAARLDDIAARAGVAKGTLYLYFESKEMLFEELLREAATPMYGRLARIAADPRISGRDAIKRLLDAFRREIVETDARHLVRLLLSEGPRFPALTAFYYREILSRAVPLLRQILERAHERGEIRSRKLLEVPQLVMAPALAALMWEDMFGRFEQLDVETLFNTHADLLTTGEDQ